MWMLSPVFLALVLVFSLLGNTGDAGYAQQQVRTSEEIKQYRSFVAVAQSFFATQDDAAALKAYHWNDMQHAGPPGLHQALMSPAWYAIKSETGTWAACTDVRDESLVSISTMFPQADHTLKLKKIDDMHTVGDEETAQAAVALCALGD